MFINADFTFSEHVEDLFNGSLFQGVFGNKQLGFILFEVSKDFTNRNSSFDTETIEISEVFNDIESTELFRDELHDIIACLFNEYVLHKQFKRESFRGIQIFKEDFSALSFCDGWKQLGALEFLECDFQLIHLDFLTNALKASSFSLILDFNNRGLMDFNFNLIAFTEFVLNFLNGSNALQGTFDLNRNTR